MMADDCLALHTVFYVSDPTPFSLLYTHAMNSENIFCQEE